MTVRKILLTASLALWPTLASAQVVDIPAIVTLDVKASTWANAAYTYQFEADLDDAAGDMSRQGVQLALGHRFELSENWYFATQLNYLGSYYDFSRAAGSGGGGASYRWKDVHTLTVFGLFGYKASPQWSWVAGGLFKLSQEQGADHNAGTGGLVVGFDYTASDTLKLGLLIGASSQIEDDAAIIPLPTVDWRFSDTGRLQFGVLGALGHPGIGPELSFQLSEGVHLGVGAAFQRRRYRLDDYANNNVNRGPAFSWGGVGDETAVPVYARLRFRPIQRAFFDVYAGATVGGRLRVENSNGNRINETDYDPAPILGLRGMILF